MAVPIDRGTQYTAFIEAELKREGERRDSVNTRAVSAVTGSTALATLVLAVFAVLIGRDAVVHGPAKISITIAVMALLLASGCAVEAARTRTGELLSMNNLRTLLTEEHWIKDNEPNARYHSCKYMLDEIESLRGGTTKRGKWLRRSALLQLVAVAALAFSVIFVAFTQDQGGGNHKQGHENSSEQQDNPNPRSDCQSPLTFLLLC